jgi:outer membrane lipoprotein-sorting protein
MIRWVIAAFAAYILLCSTLTASAQSPTSDPQAIMEQMGQRNPSLASYKARVHVNIRMTSFPYYAPKLDGTSYFKRPNNFEVVFDRLPPFVPKSFARIFNDIGDPSAWAKDQNITFDGTQTIDGAPMLVLRLTKKIHSDILDHTLAFVDPANYELRRMEWHYTSGGTIVMTQAYRQEGGYTIISTQHATISIPHIRAVADSTYATYDTNVAIDDSVFKKQ